MNDLIILATLLQRPLHGYQLKRQAGLILGQEVLHNNVVYPLLRRFTTKKWVSRKTVPGERGQNRQQYAITALGRKELITRLSTFDEQDARSSSGFRFRVGMFQMLEPERRESILQMREQYLRMQLERMSVIQESFYLNAYASAVTEKFCEEAGNELEWIQHLRRISK
jgi:DNA-binding PadR family transcriptional regulator